MLGQLEKGISMPKFHYVEASIHLNDAPDVLYFRHAIVTARTECEAYSVGMNKQLGRSHERWLNNYVIPIGGEAAMEDWPALSGPSAPSRDELEVLVRDWALRRLTLAWDECDSGRVNADAEEACIAAGVRLADFAACLGGARVEALVRDVEQEFSKHCAPVVWASFSARIIPDSQEGRYPCPSCPVDQYRAPFLTDQERSHSMTDVQPRADIDNPDTTRKSDIQSELGQPLRGGDSRLRNEELEALVTHWAEQRLRVVASYYANSDAPRGEDDEECPEACVRVEQLAEWLGIERVEELVQAAKRSWARKMAPDVWNVIGLCRLPGVL